MESRAYPTVLHALIMSYLPRCARCRKNVDVEAFNSRPCRDVLSAKYCNPCFVACVEECECCDHCANCMEYVNYYEHNGSVVVYQNTWRNWDRVYCNERCLRVHASGPKPYAIRQCRIVGSLVMTDEELAWPSLPEPVQRLSAE